MKGTADSFSHFECKQCERSRTNADIMVRIMSGINNMDPGLYNIVLSFSKLMGVEEMLMAIVHVGMKVCRLSKGIISYKKTC